MSKPFIVFEGPEGAGKSTQIKHLHARLTQAGLHATITREPGGTPASDAIRNVILDPDLSINPLTEFLLYSASRAQHVSDVIKPALNNNHIVISDRYYGASIAYQGYGRGLELDFIQDLTERVTGGVHPDLVLLLDIDPKQGLERIAKRGNKDRLELADLAFHERVREGFLQQAKQANWQTLNANQDEEALAADVWSAVSALLKVNA